MSIEHIFKLAIVLLVILVSNFIYFNYTGNNFSEAQSGPSLATVPSVMVVGRNIISMVIGPDDVDITVSVPTGATTVLALDSGCSNAVSSVTKRNGHLVSIVACNPGTVLLSVVTDSDTIEYSVQVNARPDPTATPVPEPTGIKSPTNLSVATSTAGLLTISWDYDATPSPDINNFEVQKLISQHGWGTVGLVSKTAGQTAYSHSIAPGVHGYDAATRAYFRIRANSLRASSNWIGTNLDGDDPVAPVAGVAAGAVGAPVPYDFAVTTAANNNATWSVNTESEYYDEITGYELQELDFSIGWVTVANPAHAVSGSQSATVADARDGDSFRIRTKTYNLVSNWVYYSISRTIIDEPLHIANPYDLSATANGTSTIALSWQWDADIQVINHQGFEVQGLNHNNVWVSVHHASVTTTNVDILNLAPDTEYSFRVRALTNHGASIWVGATAITDADVSTTLPDDSLITPATFEPPPIPITWYSNTSSTLDFHTVDASLDSDVIRFEWPAPEVGPHVSVVAYEIVEYAPEVNVWLTVAIVSRDQTEFDCAIQDSDLDFCASVAGLILDNQYLFALRTIYSNGVSTFTRIRVITSDDYMGTPTPTLEPSVILWPTNFVVTSTTESTIVLSWNAPDPLPAGFLDYKLERYDLIYAPEEEDYIAGWLLVTYNNNDDTSTAIEYTDTGLEEDTTYRYRIRTRTNQGNSEIIETQGTTSFAAVTDKLLPPDNFAAVANMDSITLSWEHPSPDVNNKLFYEIQELAQELGGAEDWITTERAAPTATSFTVTHLLHSTTYYFRIRTVAQQGHSAWVQAAIITDATPGEYLPPIGNPVAPPLDFRAVQTSTSTFSIVQLTWDQPVPDVRTSAVAEYQLFIYASEIGDFVNIGVVNNNGESIVTIENMCDDSLTPDCTVYTSHVDLYPGEINLFAIRSYDIVGNFSQYVTASVYVTGVTLDTDILPPENLGAEEITVGDVPWVRLYWDAPSEDLRTAPVDNYIIYLESVEGGGQQFSVLDSYQTEESGSVWSLSDPLALATGLSDKCNDDGTCSVAVGYQFLEPGLFYTFSVASIDEYQQSGHRVLVSIRMSGKKRDARVLQPLNPDAYDIRNKDKLLTNPKPWIRLQWDHPATSTHSGIADIVSYRVYMLEYALEADQHFYVPLDVRGLADDSIAYNDRVAILELFDTDDVTDQLTAVARREIFLTDSSMCDDDGCGVQIYNNGRFDNATNYTFGIESLDRDNDASDDRTIVSVTTIGKRSDAHIPLPSRFKGLSLDTANPLVYLSWKSPEPSTNPNIADVAGYNLYLLENAIEIEDVIRTPIDAMQFNIIGAHATTTSATQVSNWQDAGVCDNTIQWESLFKKYRFHNNQLEETVLADIIKDNECNIFVSSEYIILGAKNTFILTSYDANLRESEEYITTTVTAGGESLKPNGLPVLMPTDLAADDISTTGDDRFNNQVLLTWVKPIEATNEATVVDYEISIRDYAEEVMEETFQELDVLGVELSNTGEYESDLLDNKFNILNTEATSLTDKCGNSAKVYTRSHECAVVIGGNQLNRGVIYTFAVHAVDGYGNRSLRPALVTLRVGGADARPVDADVLEPVGFELRDVSIYSDEELLPDQYWIELSWYEPLIFNNYSIIDGYEIILRKADRQGTLSLPYDITEDIFLFESTDSDTITRDSVGDDVTSATTSVQALQQALCDSMRCRGAFGNGFLESGLRYMIGVRSVNAFEQYSDWVEDWIELDAEVVSLPIDPTVPAPHPFRAYDDAVYAENNDVELSHEEIDGNWIILTWREPKPNNVAPAVDHYFITEWGSPESSFAGAPVDAYKIISNSVVDQSVNTDVDTTIHYGSIITDIEDMCTGFMLMPTKTTTGLLAHARETYGFWQNQRDDIDNETDGANDDGPEYFSRYEFTTQDSTENIDVSITIVAMSDNGALNYNPEIALYEKGTDINLSPLSSNPRTGSSVVADILIGANDTAAQYVFDDNELDALEPDTEYVLYAHIHDTDGVTIPYYLVIEPLNPIIPDAYINQYAGQESICTVAVGNGNLLPGETYGYTLYSVDANGGFSSPKVAAAQVAGRRPAPPVTPQPGAPEPDAWAKLYPEPNRLTRYEITEYRLSGSTNAWPVRIITDAIDDLFVHIAESITDECSDQVPDTTELLIGNTDYRRSIIEDAPVADEYEWKVCLYAAGADGDIARLRLLQNDYNDTVLQEYNIVINDPGNQRVFEFGPILDFYREGEQYPIKFDYLLEHEYSITIDPDPESKGHIKLQRIATADLPSNIAESLDDLCDDVTFTTASSSALTLNDITDSELYFCVAIINDATEFTHTLTLNITSDHFETIDEEYSIRIIEEDRELGGDNPCDTNGDGVISDDELDRDDDGIVETEDYIACGYDRDNDGVISQAEKDMRNCSDRLCLNLAIEAVCNSLSIHCNGNLLRIFVVLLVALVLSMWPLVATVAVLSRATEFTMLFSFLLFNLIIWAAVPLVNFPVYLALAPLLILMIFGSFFIVRKIQNR